MCLSCAQLNWNEQLRVFMSSVWKIFQGNSWTNSSFLYPCKFSLSICIMLIKISGYDRCRGAVFFSPLGFFRLLTRLSSYNLLLEYCNVIWVSVKCEAGTGTRTGRGTRSIFFFKECYFRVRVRVSVNPNPAPNPAPTPTLTLTPTPTPTRRRILHHSQPWKQTRRF